MSKSEGIKYRKPIRILHVNSAMGLGGTDIMIMNLFREIDRSKFQFDFLYYTDEICHFDKEIISLGGRIYRVSPPSKINYWGFVRNVRKVINSAGVFSVIHIHTMLNSGLVAYAAKKEGIPTRIVHSHSTRGGKKENLYYKLYEKVMKNLIISSGTKFISCGKEAGEYLFGEKLFALEGILFPNAIDIYKYQQTEKAEVEETKDALAIEDGTIVVGQIGSLIDVKNHEFSIEIAKKLKEEKLNFCMLFVGDGENRDILERKINQYGLSDNVKFLGLRNDVPLLLKVFDILIMPSLFEGVPVTLIEAQAANTLSVVSKEISDEVDFKLGLIKYLDLREPVSEWANEIIKGVRIGKGEINVSNMNKVFSERGYLIQDSVKKLMSIYSK